MKDEKRITYHSMSNSFEHMSMENIYYISERVIMTREEYAPIRNIHLLGLLSLMNDDNGTTDSEIEDEYDDDDLEKNQNLRDSQLEWIQQQETCSICLEELCAKNSKNLLNCTHCFHNICIENWIVKKNSNCCPNCRQ